MLNALFVHHKRQMSAHHPLCNCCPHHYRCHVEGIVDSSSSKNSTRQARV